VNDAEDEQAADEIGRQTVLDISIEDSGEALDVTPGAETEEDQDDEKARTRRRLLELARMADALRGEKDEKLKKLVTLLKTLIKDGFNLIVFCRFIETSNYVAEALRNSLSKGVEVASVTGTLPPADREQRVADLGKAEKRVLVCTDCLSEGVNLQEHFDAVVHYDLSWNPTRHEQREGRVDRYGQASDQVRVITYYSADNRIDGIVLDVLLRKHKTIRNALGISVPLPVDSNQVMQAILEGLLLRKKGAGAFDDRQMTFDMQFYKPEQEKLHSEWDNVAEREKRSRTMFAQESIKVDDVRKELDAVRCDLHDRCVGRNSRVWEEHCACSQRSTPRYPRPVPSWESRRGRAAPCHPGCAAGRCRAGTGARASGAPRNRPGRCAPLPPSL